MNSHANIHILKDAKGEPAFAVLPYADYLSLTRQGASNATNSVVGKVINTDMKSIRDWRLHFGFTQLDMALRLGISRNAFTHYEVNAPIKRSTREKIAGALGVAPEKIDFSKGVPPLLPDSDA